MSALSLGTVCLVTILVEFVLFVQFGFGLAEQCHSCRNIVTFLWATADWVGLIFEFWLNHFMKLLFSHYIFVGIINVSRWVLLAFSQFWYFSLIWAERYYFLVPLLSQLLNWLGRLARGKDRIWVSVALFWRTAYGITVRTFLQVLWRRGPLYHIEKFAWGVRHL